MNKNKLRFSRNPNSKIQFNSNSILKKVTHKFSTLELIFLVSLPIDAVIYFMATVQNKPMIISQKLQTIVEPEYNPDQIEKIIPPIEIGHLDQPIKVEPVIVKNTEEVISSDLAEEIRKEKEYMNDWGKDLVEWNREANIKVKESIKKYAMKPPEEGRAKPRHLGSMTYGFQDDSYSRVQQQNFASRSPATSANSNGFVAASVASVFSFNPTSGKTCSVRPPLNKDSSCRANYPCRICGGCCCNTEAKLAHLI